MIKVRKLTAYYISSLIIFLTLILLINQNESNVDEVIELVDNDKSVSQQNFVNETKPPYNQLLALPILENSNSIQKTVEKKQLEWNVHPDGTVINQGTTIWNRTYSLIINNENKCQSLRNDSLSFIVMILSAAANFEQRQTIRETWANDVMQQIGNFRVFFLIGLTNNTDTQERLVFENMIYEDLLQISIFDSFANLTYKSINMLRWYIKYCPNANFLYKTDDDIYIHLPNVRQLLANSTNLNNSILCRRNRSRKILRNANIKDLFFYHSIDGNKDKQLIEQSRKKFRKYIVEYKQLPGNLYPDYCSGYSYVIKYSVAKKLFDVSKTIPYIGIEDVFVTGFCRSKANITISNNYNFRLNPIIHPIESRCAFEEGRINSNELDIGDIKTLWTHVNTQGYYCKLTHK